MHVYSQRMCASSRLSLHGCQIQIYIYTCVYEYKYVFIFFGCMCATNRFLMGAIYRHACVSLYSIKIYIYMFICIYVYIDAYSLCVCVQIPCEARRRNLAAETRCAATCRICQSV